ncbi:MAG TPA: hypothetical protein VFM05_02430, partial [Candidatus Saccharimonadales bacterium]|nr:hypothetical protein [Candidatus Saccharimonadales bacterium]
AGNSIKVRVNGKLQPANTVDTTSLTNGVHTIEIEENGKVTAQLVSVDNPPLLAALNQARANAALYITSFVVIFGGLAIWFGRSYVTGLVSRREARLVKAQRRIK